MDKKLLDILVCPQCQGRLSYDKVNNQLLCLVDGLGYPIEDHMPILLVSSAQKIKS